MAVGVDFLKQEGRVGGQRAHGLHALGVELHLALAGTVGDVSLGPTVGAHLVTADRNTVGQWAMQSSLSPSKAQWK